MHHVQQYHGCSTVAAARTAPDPATQAPTLYSSTAARTAAVREYVDAQVVAASYWDFNVLTIPRHIGDLGRLLSTLSARRVWRWGPFFRR